MQIETITEYLKCPLSEKELRKQAELMAQCLSQIEVYEADLRSIKKRIESDIAKCQADLTSAVEKVRTGFEMKNIKCNVEKDFQTNTLRTYRLDTGEMINERALTGEERQLMLDLEKKKEEAPAAESEAQGELPLEGAEASGGSPSNTEPATQTEAA